MSGTVPVLITDDEDPTKLVQSLNAALAQGTPCPTQVPALLLLFVPSGQVVLS